ncbi:hypothetical protein ACH5RR_027001 [Cinchona calisaya]|uniref:Uncharacterized protein n=1 Tax=Cinchona calisaya TaxID=153742 RepID=A0ABD2Z648_9GENT
MLLFSMENNNNVLHVVVFPWLAMGHLIPFLQLSKQLAQKGHKVSFISTPRNLQRLPKIPSDLASLLNLVSIPIPEKVENLPDQAESSMDIPHEKEQFLKIAFDLLQSPIATFLETTRPKPDWILYDYASHWLPEIAAKNGISSAYFSLFTAATMAFIGPPSILLNGGDGRSTSESFTVLPRWIPFPSNIAYRLHEVAKHVEDSSGNESGTPDVIRFAASVEGSDLVVFRTCVEFEPEWFDLVCELYKKPVISLGVLPPSLDDDGLEADEKWLKIRGWLGKQNSNRVIYVALGTEATLGQKEVHDLAIGLEQSDLPFFWVLRTPPGSNKDVSEMLPEGFIDRINANDRGVVYMDWAPQVKILSHPAVGGFLTHCGWNSVIEALGFGLVLILFPVMNDQGLNARLLEGKKVGVEIPREAENGLFTSTAVAETLRYAMVSKEGESIRSNAREMKSLFGKGNRNQGSIDSFVRCLEEKKTSYSL